MRKLAGIKTAQYTTYYNLAGPEKHCAVGRIDHKDVFTVKMAEGEYKTLLQENRSEREAYSALYKIHEEK
jgi:hypothetical protein